MVEDALRETIAREEAVPNLHDGLLYSLGLDTPQAAKGKRLRPLLCLATAEVLGAKPATALPFACAIELMHNFALVHDDIEDGDEVRRGRPTTWKRYGLAHGVNIGDYIFCKVLSTLAHDGDLDDALRLRLLRLMSSTLDHTHVGQSLDISARDGMIDVQGYMRLVREKTGFYLAAPMLGGALCAGADDSILEAIRAYGEAIGPMFQIRDDLLDLSPAKGRDAIGSDIREGKRSFLVAHAFTQLAHPQRDRLRTILDTPRAETTDAMVDEAISLLQSAGAMDAAETLCRELEAKGLAAIQTLPTELRGLLEDFCRYLVGRKN
jgi:geranylgeranyl diphosphate synthase type I